MVCNVSLAWLPLMKSVYACSSNELQRLDYMIGYQNSRPSNGHKMTWPVSLHILAWLEKIDYKYRCPWWPNIVPFVSNGKPVIVREKCYRCNIQLPQIITALPWSFQSKCSRFICKGLVMQINQTKQKGTIYILYIILFMILYNWMIHNSSALFNSYFSSQVYIHILLSCYKICIHIEEQKNIYFQSDITNRDQLDYANNGYSFTYSETSMGSSM